MGRGEASDLISDSDENPKDRQFVTALSRGLSVLNCFARAHTELGTSEIARLTGLPQPTVWRLCYTMLKLGYLVQARGSDKLRLGVPVLGLGYAVLADQNIAQLASPYMQELSDQCEGAVALSMREGHDMLYLHRCVGPKVMFVEQQRVPLATSVTGWGYIAGLGPVARSDIFAEFKAVYGPAWQEMEKQIVKAIAAYEKTGYILGKGIIHREVNSVAVPIISSDGSLVLVLTCGGIASVFTEAVLRSIGKSLIKIADLVKMALRSDYETKQPLKQR
jgi:DNA-binding IclR family transcriptional regulator